MLRLTLLLLLAFASPARAIDLIAIPIEIPLAELQVFEGGDPFDRDPVSDPVAGTGSVSVDAETSSGVIAGSVFEDADGIVFDFQGNFTRQSSGTSNMSVWGSVEISFQVPTFGDPGTPVLLLASDRSQ